ncbi:3'(2'),5'-bisphosphate nucleotidase CysQ [Erythrobacter sp. YT30]|uniref:3'(2'),5'-bisphosphate nucleotidase CysQ n=1 Tax=Erythrobacter sp. YT30 TaxID=1735012 RepID=UPI00076DB842|nr:3'(2'),5'-bisphosphate nucleotidase CysQ [Erythrobacter sp. YT30]KWV91341.1 3'(2'),5'-bisphosphate nucleotidase CysQ [Erythrobacter sp. YT30]
MIDRVRLEQIIREAGRIALSRWPGGGHDLASWDKTPGNPVSEADLEVDAFLKRELRALLPSAGWLSEETADDEDRLNRDLLWMVDPVDGTRDFIRGRDGWAVSVALISAGKPLLGTLFAPARGEIFSAEAGRGAQLNGKPITASRRTKLGGARIPVDQLPEAVNDLLIVQKPNSIALRIAMVAADQADLVATLRWGYEWDVAAATLIAREAGAQVSEAFGKPLNFNKRDPRDFGVLVSSPAIHEAIAQRIRPMAETLRDK